MSDVKHNPGDRRGKWSKGNFWPWGLFQRAVAKQSHDCGSFFQRTCHQWTESNIHELFDLSCENKLFTGLDGIFRSSSSIVFKFPLVVHNRWATCQFYLQTVFIRRTTEMEGERSV